MSGLTSSVHYSYDFKMRVIETVLKGEESMESASRRFDIGGHTTIAKWMRKLERSNVDLILKKNKPSSSDKEARIKELEEALAFEKLRSRAYEEMIKIAESEHKISIKKKRDTKQSKK